MSSHKNKAGFTLMEILVALTIIVAILAMVYGSFAATTRSMDASSARMAQIERVCFALRLMTRQIRCAYAPDISRGSATDTARQSSSGLTSNDPVTHTCPIQFQGNCGDSRGEILSFVTSSGLGNGPDAPRGLLRVSYLYDRLSSTLSLSRQDQSGSSDSQVRPKHSDLLLSDVTGVELKFYDGRQWQQTWDAGQRHELPRAVKVEITAADDTGRSHLLGTTIPIVEQTSPECASTKRTVAAGQL